MDIIEAGKICRDAGFNWGRGSWWHFYNIEGFVGKSKSRTVACDFVQKNPIPDLSKGATRGVILEWVQHQVCDEKVHIGFCLGYYWVFSEKYTTERLDANSWHSAYARLCQWAKEELK